MTEEENILKHKFWAMVSRLGLILLGILVGLIALELVFRILYPDPSPKLLNQGLQHHPTHGIAFIPNVEGWNTSLRGEYSAYIKINSQGLRGQAYPYHKDNDTFRILVLGDSFTAALQVVEEKTFVKLLEHRLQQQYPTTNFEVINAGVVGYGTGNALSYFMYEGYKYQSDLVLLAFFTGNDISDNVNPPHYKLANGQLTPIKATYRADFMVPPWAVEGTLFRKIRNFLYTHSRLYSVTIELLTFSAVQKIPALTNLLISLGFVEATRPAMNAGNIYSFLNPSEEAWQMTEAIILRLKQEVDGHGSQLVVVILPDETEVDQQKWATIFAAYPDLKQKKALVNFQPTERLSQFLQQVDSLYLPLLPALQAYQANTNEPLYYKYDGHWRPAGHRVAAEAIYNYLIQNQAKVKNFPGN